MINRNAFFVIFLLNFFIQNFSGQTPPVVPLTNALTAVYCHHSDGPGIMTIRCRPNEKIRMLDAFDAAVRDKSRLPVQCLKERTKDYSIIDSERSNLTDCKVHTSFTSACSGRENCTLHMQRIRLNSARDHCQNDLVDYTMAFFECISDAFIHDVCSSQSITSAWGTLQTPNFPNPYTSSDDCWCKLSTQYQHQLLLSVIVFQLIPYDQHCAGAGLYLQSSDQQRSTQCTYLQQGHNYLSDTNTLYINFYSRIPTVRGGFWIIYEASHPMAEVHLHCGSRDKIGVPVWSTSSPNSVSPPPISTPFDHGWTRLAFDNILRRTTVQLDPSMKTHLPTTTPYSRLNTSTPIGAFTYPHGSLTTFEVAYGPLGWYLKHPAYVINKTWIPDTRPVATTSEVKWNYTWRYTKPIRNRFFTNRTQPTRLPSKVTTNMRTTTFRTTIATPFIVTTTVSTITVARTTSFITTDVPSTTTSIRTTTTTTTTSTISTTTMTTTTTTTTIRTSTTSVTTETTTTTIDTPTPHQRLLFTHTPWVYVTTSIAHPPPSVSTTTSSTPENPSTSTPLVPIKMTGALPTPWYSPAGMFDWWQWQWYTSKGKKTLIPLLFTSTTMRSTNRTTPSTTTSTTTTTRTTTTTVSTTSTTTTTTTTTTSTRTTTTRKTTTTTITTTTTTVTTRRTTPKIIITTPSKTSKTTTTKDKIPFEVSGIVKKDPIDDFDEEYRDWLDYLTTNEIHELVSSTRSTPSISSVSPRQQLPSFVNSFTRKPSGFSSDPRLNPGPTLPAKRHHSQHFPGVSERNAIAIPVTDPGGNANYHNMIRRVIEQRGKKSGNDQGWLSKTDMTIVAVSILFVILLAIINLILFAVRRHRHRLQGRHLLSSSMPGTSNDRRLGGNRNFLRGPAGTNSEHALINGSNANPNNDILPAVGEIVIWDEKDQGGYMIDNNGAWAKIEGRQWFGSQIFKNCSKTSLSKSFRSRFRLMRQTEKKTLAPHAVPITPKSQPNFKFPLMMETATLSPVPEADDYESSDLSLSDVMVKNPRQTHQALIKSGRKQNLAVQQHQTKVVQAMVHSEQQEISSDDYYKRIEHQVDDSNYILMQRNPPANDPETDRSVGMEIDGGGQMLVSVPTLFRRDDDDGTMTDGAESMYNPHYSIETLVECPNYLHPNLNTSNVVVGHCQTEFQPLDPKLLLKSNEKVSRSSQSVHLSTYDSGFVDEHAVESSMAVTPTMNISESHRRAEIHLNLDEIQMTKSEDEDDDGLTNDASVNPSNRQKWKNMSKRVSFQEEHVVQQISPSHVEVPDHLFETYDIAANLVENGAGGKSESVDETSPTSSSVFTVQKTSLIMENEETDQTIIMDHLHSVKSLKKFFETKMIIQRPNLPPAPSTMCTDLTRTNESEGRREELMDQVLESLKRKKTSLKHVDHQSESSNRSGPCSTTTTSSIDYNLAVHGQYSRRFRSSSTSNHSTGVTTNIFRDPSRVSQATKRAVSQDRQYYQTTDHILQPMDSHRLTFESDDDDNISESSMLWQARTKLNEFMSRTRKSQQQRSSTGERATPTEDLYTFDENDSVTAETRF